jgi:hypothetical protein
MLKPSFTTTKFSVDTGNGTISIGLHQKTKDICNVTIEHAFGGDDIEMYLMGDKALKTFSYLLKQVAQYIDKNMQSPDPEF